jgi:VWFA-related protein
LKHRATEPPAACRGDAAARTGTASTACRWAASFLLVAFLLPLAAARSQQRPAFTSTVARVRVDVIVTDAQGRFVDDLRPDEFILYEDEIEQQVLSTQIVDLARGTVLEYVPGAAADPGGAASYAAAPTTRPVTAAASRDFGAIIFLVDLPGLDRRNKDRFADAWLEVLDSSALLGVPRAVYMIDQVGRLRELAPLSLSADALRGAAEEVLTAPLVRPGIHARLLRVAADTLADDSLDFVAPQATDLNEIRASEAEEAARSRTTLELLTQFCNALSAREGRTALVWVSSEVLLAAGGPGTALVAAYVEGSNPGVEAGTVDRSRRTGDTLFSYLAIDSRTSVLQRALHHAANSANVSIYTLDPAPEHERRAMPIDVRVASPALAELLDSTTVQASLDNLRDAFREAADATGGRAAIGATDLDTALRRIEEDTARFYLLSYAPAAQRGDGAFHTTRVDVRRPGVTVRQRAGYVDFSPEERAARAITAALALPGSVDALPVDVRALRGWSTDGEPVVKLVIGLERDLAQQQAGPPDVFFHRVHAVALDEGGAVVDEINQQMQFSEPPPRRIRSGARPAVYVHEWALPPGSFDVRVAVRDGSNGEIGASGLRIDVPPPSTAWSAGDLMLAAGDEHGTAQPLLSGWVYRDEPLFAYIEVSGGTAPELTGQILDAGGVEQLVELPATSLAADMAGVHRGALRLRNLPAGDYLLEIELVDRAAGHERSFRVPLQVLDS